MQIDFSHLDALIENYIQGLPALSSLQNSFPRPSPELIRSLVVTHSLARVAVVQLHIAFADESLKSAAKCLSACKAIIGAISCVAATTLCNVDPLMLVRPNKQL